MSGRRGWRWIKGIDGKMIWATYHIQFSRVKKPPGSSPTHRKHSQASFFFPLCPLGCVICKDQTRGKVVHWSKAIVMLSPQALLQHSAMAFYLLYRSPAGKRTSQPKIHSRFYRGQHHFLLLSSFTMENQATLHFLSGWPKIKRGKSNLWLFSSIFSTAVALLTH